MHSRNYQDIGAGLLLTLIGGWFAVYSASHYGRGTLGQIGDGAFPAGAGITLAFFGILIAIGGLSRPGEPLSFQIKAPFFILISTAAFAALIKPFGLVPAIVIVVILSSFADLKAKLSSLVLLCGVLTFICYLVFRVGLGLLIPVRHGGRRHDIARLSDQSISDGGSRPHVGKCRHRYIHRCRPFHLRHSRNDEVD